MLSAARLLSTPCQQCPKRLSTKMIIAPVKDIMPDFRKEKAQTHNNA